MTAKDKIFVEMMLKNPKNEFSVESITEALETFNKSPSMCRKIINIFVANNMSKKSLNYDFNPWYEETKNLKIDLFKAEILHSYIKYIDDSKNEELIEFCEKNPIYTYELQEKLKASGVINKKEKDIIDIMFEKLKENYSKNLISEALEIFYKSPSMCRKIINIFVANGASKIALDYDFNPWYEETKELKIDIPKAKILRAYINYIDKNKHKELIEYCEKNPIYSYELQEKLGLIQHRPFDN